MSLVFLPGARSTPKQLRLLSSVPITSLGTPRSAKLIKASAPNKKTTNTDNNKMKSNSTTETMMTPSKTILSTTGSSNGKGASPPLAGLFNAMEYIIDKYVEPHPLRTSVDPSVVFSGNFAPVSELRPTPCAVTSGVIPDCLQGGAYIRNGPNPQHLPPHQPYHLLHGDAMLHSILLSSPPLLSSRYVRSHRYTAEKAAGAHIFPDFFAFRGLAGLARFAVTTARTVAGHLNISDGIATPSTSLAFLFDRLFAFGEPDLPYAMGVSAENGDVTTMSGIAEFTGANGVTSHPKKDPVTREVFCFRSSQFKPYLTYVRFDGDGKKHPEVPICSVSGPTLMHDFAITENYALFHETQMVMDIFGIASDGMVKTDPRKTPRIGILPKYATSGSEIRWFDAPGVNAMHFVNAWEEDGGEAVIAVLANALTPEYFVDRLDLMHHVAEMVRIDLDTGTVTKTSLSALNLDAGLINPSYLGKKSRYSYHSVSGPLPKTAGVVKLDLELARTGTDMDCVVSSRVYERGCFGGEPFFVADGGEDEDAGYVVTFMHDENIGESRFLVMDARSPELEIVAEVVLPRRVPYGFHGIFVRKEDLENQTCCGN